MSRPPHGSSKELSKSVCASRVQFSLANTGVCFVSGVARRSKASGLLFFESKFARALEPCAYTDHQPCRTPFEVCC